MIKTTIKLAHCTSTIPRGREGIKVFSCPPFNQPKVSYYALYWVDALCFTHTPYTHTYSLSLPLTSPFAFFLFLSFFLSCTGTTHFILLPHSSFFGQSLLLLLPLSSLLELVDRSSLFLFLFLPFFFLPSSHSFSISHLSRLSKITQATTQHTHTHATSTWMKTWVNASNGPFTLLHCRTWPLEYSALSYTTLWRRRRRQWQ